MFVTPDFLRRDDLPPVVVIGSGPAGLTLALSLAERRIPSLVLEAGEEFFSPDTQDEYSGRTTGDTYFDLDATRLRQFGGSSNHWAGWCRPLDAWDFDAVPEISVPGWPIARSDLDAFAQRARDILEIEEPLDQSMGGDIFEVQYVYSPPVRFNEKYGPTIQSSPLVHVALKTPVIAILAEGGRINGLEVMDANGDRLTLSPEYVVLASGGIENSRLLLWSNEVSPQRVVADAGPVGKYWMEHPHEDVGHAVLHENIHVNARGPFNTFWVGVQPERLARFGALNAVLGFVYDYPQTLRRQVERGICTMAPELVDTASDLTDINASCGHQVRIIWEQAPDIDNRVTLSESERDKFGIPRPHLFWRKTARDYQTAKVAFELIGTHLVRTGRGLIRADPHLIGMGDYPEGGRIGGNHHLGGTRMSESPREGVVDRNLKIHGMTNGYVAGSSVFVRGGHATPTYTIVQLSLRLADHLAADMGR